jgi:hypothetical protein
MPADVMRRIIVRPKDVSALSLIAQQPRSTKSLVKGLSLEAMPIGVALTSRHRTAGRSQVEIAARYLRNWAGTKRVEFNASRLPAAKTSHIYKSAKTGRIVSVKYAKSHPATTFRERIVREKSATKKRRR